MRTMRPGWRRAIGVLAIYAIALHVVLAGLVPVGAGAATVDPLSVICHSVAPAAADRDQGKSIPAPGHGCDHCNLCSVAAPPPAPVTALDISLKPARALHVLRPLNTAVRTARASNPKLARGPPREA